MFLDTIHIAQNSPVTQTARQLLKLPHKMHKKWKRFPFKLPIMEEHITHDRSNTVADAENDY